MIFQNSNTGTISILFHLSLWSSFHHLVYLTECWHQVWKPDCVFLSLSPIPQQIRVEQNWTLSLFFYFLDLKHASIFITISAYFLQGHSCGSYCIELHLNVDPGKAMALPGAKLPSCTPQGIWSPYLPHTNHFLPTTALKNGEGQEFEPIPIFAMLTDLSRSAERI